jgi:cysteinyl-tRNA synthetase
MEHNLYIYNTLSRKKEQFVPLHDNKVGMYVCGPTVYGDGHLGHARPAITFDILFRYLTHLGYKVRYVRNITDVGHLENDADSGEDKIAKKARLDELEPMEVVQYYTNRYHKAMDMLNVLPPSIEPFASGHIIEQMEVANKILYKRKLAYKGLDGSIYFDVLKYNEKFKSKNIQYGILSGRDINDIITNTRELDGQQYKKNSFDFALLKKADKSHIMKWPSYPFYNMFPGWHLECTAMSTKYLGKQFDIHGGGMDLKFPHHECEIAQGVAVNGVIPARYWMHNNMITINGQKMGKSLGNFITLEEFFTGNHPLLTQPFSPMTVRFFILQAHYGGTVDFSSAALEASEKGLSRLMDAVSNFELMAIDYSREDFIVDLGDEDFNPRSIKDKIYTALNDDLNTPIAISFIFEAIKIVNLLKSLTSSRPIGISQNDYNNLSEIFNTIVKDILGLKSETEATAGNEAYKKAIDLLLNMRLEAKQNKDWATSDKIRNELTALGFEIKDTKDGFEWKI